MLSSSDSRMFPVKRKQGKLSDSVKETEKGGEGTRNNGKENVEKGNGSESDGRGKENVNESSVREKKKGREKENEKELEKKNEVEDAPELQFRGQHQEIGSTLIV